MPSMPGDGRDRSQLALPQAPRFDRYGQHAHECECARCNLGFRPTPTQRDAARRAFERMEQRRKAEADRIAAGLGAKAKKRSARAEGWREREKHTDEMIGKLSAPVVRPATADELAEMKREFPNLRRRRDRR